LQSANWLVCELTDRELTRLRFQLSETRRNFCRFLVTKACSRLSRYTKDQSALSGNSLACRENSGCELLFSLFDLNVQHAYTFRS